MEEKTSFSKIDILENFLTENYKLRNNQINNKIEFMDNITNEWDSLNEFNILRSLRKKNHNIKINELIECIKSDYTEKFNPFQHYFENLKYNKKTDYIKELCKYIKVGDKDYFETSFKKHLVRTVACSLGINFNKQCFVLVGEGMKNQNMGKSSFIRFLIPEVLNEYYTEELSIDKDGFISLAENMIINLDELSTLQKTEINQLKSYMSKDFIKVRLPYERKASLIKRRASFFGSTNEQKFLTDLTGNVRWICHKIYDIDWNYSKNIDINNVWAQSYYLLKNEFKYNLTVEEIQMNEVLNNDFMQLPADYELLQQYFEIIDEKDSNLYGVQFLTTSEICKLLNDIVKGSIKFNVVSVGRSLKKLGFEVSQKFIKETGFQVKGYYVKYNYLSE